MTRWPCIACALFAAGSAARAQPVGLERVDAGVEDVNPFAVSSRVETVELRSPSAFEHVYRSADGQRFVRVSGAIFAEFARSEYVRTQWGDLPIRPAGTVFYIGSRETTEAPAPPSALRVSGRVSGRVDDAGSGVAGTTEAPISAMRSTVARPTVWTDEAYRQRRMAQAIERAARRDS